MFQRVVHESHEHVKNQCDLHEKLGDSNFHDRYASKILSKFVVVREFLLTPAAESC